MSFPNGTIATGAVEIHDAEFVKDETSGKYYLDLQFRDPNYKKTANAAYITYCESEPPSSAIKAQLPFQLPPYVVRLMKKTTPSSPTASTSSADITELYTDYGTFNNQKYIQKVTTDNLGARVQKELTQFGLGLVPYYYGFTSCPYSYNSSSIEETDNTYSVTVGEGMIHVKLDANGGAQYVGGSANGHTPMKQVTFGGFYQSTEQTEYSADPPTYFNLVKPDNFVYAQFTNINVYTTTFPSGPVDETLQYWNFEQDEDNNLPDEEIGEGLPDYIKIQLKAMAAYMIKFLNTTTNKQMNVKVRTGGGNMNGEELTFERKINNTVECSYDERAFVLTFSFAAPDHFYLVEGDDFLYSSTLSKYVYAVSWEQTNQFPDPLSAVPSVLQTWNLDDQFKDEDLAPSNKVYLQIKGAIAQLMAYMTVGQSKQLTIVSGTGGNSNGMILDVIKVNEAQATVTLPSRGTAYYNYERLIPSLVMPTSDGPIQLRADSFDINNGFTEPGSYLVSVIRNSIQTAHSGSYITALNPSIDWNNSGIFTSAIQTVLQPPTPNITLDPVTKNLSFTYLPYGSVLRASDGKWEMANQFGGYPSFKTPRYTYFPSDDKPSGAFPTSALTYTNLGDNSLQDGITVSMPRLNFQQIEHSPDAFDVRGVFIYDFRLYDEASNPSFKWNPYATTGGTSGYVNFDSTSAQLWNNNMTPSYSLAESSLEAHGISGNQIVDYPFSSTLEIATDPYTITGANTPIPFNSVIEKIGDSYLFHTTWKDEYGDQLTTNLVGAPYVLRLYQKSTTSMKDPGLTYVEGAVDHYKYVNDSDTGLSIETNWKSTTPVYEMDVYTDKAGNVFYSNAPSAGDFTGWTDSEIKGAWLMVIQRNFTPDGETQLDAMNEGCYVIDVGTSPIIAAQEDAEKNVTGFTTTNTVLYADASNIWNVDELDTGNYIVLEDLVSNPNPTIDEFEDAYPLRNGTGNLTNRLVNKFDVGVHFTEYLGGTYGTLVTSDISGQQLAPYDHSSNTIAIYEPKQLNSPEDSLGNISFNYTVYDTSKTYMKLNFTEPNKSELANYAYDINIFKKTQGSGTAESQWTSSVSQVAPYKYTDDSNRGVSVQSVTLDQLNGNDITLDCESTGTVRAHLQSDTNITDFAGHFETGGYFTTVRRNFARGTPRHPQARVPYFTLTSQKIDIPPSQSYFINPQVSIQGSPDISVNYVSSNRTLKVTTPIYGAYDASGNVDIDKYWLYEFEGISVPQYAPYDRFATFTDTEATLSIEGLETSYAGLGNLNAYADFSYNWSVPDDLQLQIGQIGDGYPTIAKAAPTGRIAPDLKTLAANNAISNIRQVVLPDDASWNRQNIVTSIDARFYTPDDSPYTLLGVTWDDPNPADLCSNNPTGAPYNIRLYRKTREGRTPDSQWYSPDNSGIEPFKYNSSTDQGVNIEANFFSQHPSGKVMFFFTDASGQVTYDQYPSDVAGIKPFEEGGAYMLVVQRNYQNTQGQFAISTAAHYVSFVPEGEYNPFPIERVGDVLQAQPNLYSSYKPQYYGGEEDASFNWSISIPSKSFNKPIPGQDTSSVEVSTILDAYRNFGTGIVKSDVKYDFSVYGRGVSSKVPFIEYYPVLSITGNPFPIFQSLPYELDLCVKPTEYPPPTWARFRTECDNYGFTMEELQMRRKAEVLQHNSNLHQRRMTKKAWFSHVARGYNQRGKTYATQTINFTDPNTKGYPVAGNALALPNECSNTKIITNPSSASDVPGPIVPLTYNPNVPLVRLKRTYTYPNQQDPPGPGSNIGN